MLSGVGDSLVQLGDFRFRFLPVIRKLLLACQPPLQRLELGQEILEWVRYRNSREVLGEIRSVTVSQSAGQWHVSVNTFEQVEPPRHAATAVVGIDWGVAQFITPSEGRPVDRLSPLKKFLPKLKTLQRRLARKQKFSNNWKRKRKSPSCTNASPTPESIFYIRSRRTSAKTTPLSWSKTCK